jgi:hypothetical protein
VGTCEPVCVGELEAVRLSSNNRGKGADRAEEGHLLPNCFISPGTIA